MKLLLTGGGTAGHVIPNLAIVDAIRDSKAEVQLRYIGSFHGIEKELVEKAGVDYDGIETGKWRRYWDWQNFVDLFRIPLGFVEAWWILGKHRPDLVFSKGGYVALPVVWAAWARRIPVWIHDSDASPGLTTRLCAPFATKIFLGFETARLALMRYHSKLEVVGNPVRLSLFKGDRGKALKKTGFEGKKPVLLVMGGSSGAGELNGWVENNKAALVKEYDVIHVSGKGWPTVQEKNYVRWAYVNEGLGDLYALASLALTRAGANTLAELSELKIPALLVPLSTRASRGDQLVNARILSLENPLFCVASKDQKEWQDQLKNLPVRTLHAKFRTSPQEARAASMMADPTLASSDAEASATHRLTAAILGA